ncbi:PABP-interacting PAM2 motif-containing protein [Endozoicomonas sp. 2B-B]
MNHGLTPTSATANTSSALADSITSKPQSKLNPEAPAFIPRVQSAEQHWNSPANIRDRHTTVNQKPSSLRSQQLSQKKGSGPYSDMIDNAYQEYKDRKYATAEKAFRTILKNCMKSLNQYQRHEVLLGLARSLKEQNREKQLEACSLLEELRSNETFYPFGASTVTHLELTLSQCEQALGRHLRAEKRLLMLSNKKPQANERALCEPSGNYTVDIALALLWETMNKIKLADGLLLKVVAELTQKRRSCPSANAKKKLGKFLHNANIALVRLLQAQGKHERSEKLLLEMSNKHPNASEDTLCRPCEDHVTNLSLVRIWEIMGKYKLAEKLLLNMSGKRINADEDSLCQTTKHDTDLALVRLWQLMDKNKLAEKLLLNMSGKHPDASEEVLCNPSENDDINLTLARHWEVMGKYKLAEKLLLNMSGKHPDASEEVLCKVSGKYLVDMALAILWRIMDKDKCCEKLLLNMSGKHPDADTEVLCKPSGNHKVDLTLARLWETIDGKHEWAERLLLNMSNKPPDATEEVLCKPSGNNETDLALVRLWELMEGNKHKWAERLLLNMSGKCPDASEEELCKPSGHHDIDHTLAHHWEIVGKSQQAMRLIESCCQLYHSTECELSLLNFHLGQAGFMDMIARYPENTNTLLLTSIHYFILAREQIIKSGPESGSDSLKHALELVESALAKSPTNASAVSQKAHCLRMMGASEQVWKALFNRARSLEPIRQHKDKTDHWRIKEAVALAKMKSLTKQT